MRTIVTGLMLGLIAATPAHAERFAVRCSGKKTIALGRPGVQPIGAAGLSHKVTYIIDDVAQTIDEFDPRERTLTEVCAPPMQCERSFSAERITILGGSESAEGRAAMRFDWDRTGNRLEAGWERRANDGLIMVQHATLKCKPTKMPVVEAAK